METSALDLSGRADAQVDADLGPALDAQAKRTYRRRLLELPAEVDDATVAGDATRAEQAHVEIDTLMRELRRASGSVVATARRVPMRNEPGSTSSAACAARPGRSATRHRSWPPTSTTRSAPAATASTCPTPESRSRGRSRPESTEPDGTLRSVRQNAFRA